MLQINVIVLYFSTEIHYSAVFGVADYESAVKRVHVKKVSEVLNVVKNEPKWTKM